MGTGAQESTMATDELAAVLRETLSAVGSAADPGEPVTTSEVSERLDVSRRSTYTRLERLVDSGALRSKKVGARGRVWWRPPDGADPARAPGGGLESAAVDLELQRRERAIRRAYEVTAGSDRPFPDRVDELLSVTREAIGMEYAALSRIRGEEYVFERVDGPDGADLASGEVVPLETTNCERVVETERTLVLNELERDAPELAARAGNAELGVTSYLGVPVIVDGETHGTFCFFDTGDRTDAFSNWDVTLVELLATWVEGELQRRRNLERRTAFSELNEVVSEVTDAAIERSTRAEIERAVCERLADSDSYAFAWIAEVDPSTGEVTPRAEAGVETFLEEVELSADPDDPGGRGPAGETFRTGELRASRDVFDDPAFEPWREHAERYGFRSFAAIPVVREGTLYGVIGLHSERAGAFGETERGIVGQLGGIVGHAIAAVERKQALMGDEVVELEFHTPDIFDALGADDAATDGTITFGRTIHVGDGEHLSFGRVTGEAAEALPALAETIPHWTDVTLRENGFELRFSDPPVFSVVASMGGAIREAEIEDGDYHMTLHLPPGAEVRRVIDAVLESYPSTEMVTRRQVERARDSADRVDRALAEDLTDRQRAVLRTAYHAGFFEWPRDVSGEEVAASLGVSPPTFHQHLRTAERKVFDSLLATPRESLRTDGAGGR